MLTISIASSAGKRGSNRVEDVATVQELLNMSASLPAGRVTVDGSILPSGRPKILFEAHHFSKRTG